LCPFDGRCAARGILIVKLAAIGKDRQWQVLFVDGSEDETVPVRAAAGGRSRSRRLWS